MIDRNSPNSKKRARAISRSVQILEMLQRGETWLFGESLEPSQRKRWIIALGRKDYAPVLLNFDRDLALKTIEDGGGAIDLDSDSAEPTLCERIYEWLKLGLEKFRMERLASV